MVFLIIYLFILNLFAQRKSQETWYDTTIQSELRVVRPSSGRTVLGNREGRWREGGVGVVVDGI